MKNLKNIFKNNQNWAQSMKEKDSQFFSRLSDQQYPKYLWIGCSDSRVPASKITGLEPGDMFVHRNIANLAIDTDLSCLSVVQYAVEVLNVTDIIICGHYGCGGVAAALSDKKLGLIDDWIKHIKNIYKKNSIELDDIADPQLKHDRFCEINVAQQVLNLSQTETIKNYWKNNNELYIHGLIYSLNDGLLKDLNVGVSSLEQLNKLLSE